MSTPVTHYGKQLSLDWPAPACVAASVTLSAFNELRERCEEFLSPRELTFFRTREFTRKQHSFLLGRYAAKLALAQFPGLSNPAEVDVYPGTFEQPLVRCAAAESPGISISHCDDLAVALAFPLSHPMGIDVERIDPAMTPTMHSQMCPGEIAWAGQDNDTRSALIWTGKESLSKALKCGLTASFELFEMQEMKPAPDGSWLGSFRHFQQYRSQSWHTGKHALSLVFPAALPPLNTGALRQLLSA